MTLVACIAALTAAVLLSDLFEPSPEEGYLTTPIIKFGMKDPQPVIVNENWLQKLGFWEALNADSQAVAELSNGVTKHLRGLRPFSRRYAGTQFGYFSGVLGDGRAVSLGVTKGSPALEIQLKGGGLTPFSRRGDGRCTLLSCIREYISSEYMNRIGILTTRAIAVAVSGSETVKRDVVYNGNFHLVPMATIIRSSQSFIRFGTFELAHVDGHDAEALTLLLDTIIKQYYPSCVDSSISKGDCFIQELTVKSAKLVASWQAVGFTHAVLNTDNVSVLGITIDFGPFSFMEYFDNGHIANYIDDEGMYSFNNQRVAMVFNLRKLSKALVKLGVLKRAGGVDIAAAFNKAFDEEYHRLMGDKVSTSQPVVDSLLKALQRSSCDYTLTLRSLGKVTMSTSTESFVDLISPYCPTPHQRILLDMRRERITKQYISYQYCSSSIPSSPLATDAKADLASHWEPFVKKYKKSLLLEVAASGMSPDTFFKHRQVRLNETNPMFVPRNRLLREASDAAAAGDLSPLMDLADVLSDPFDSFTSKIRDIRKFVSPPGDSSCLELTSCGS
eukprot:TRINITY_DN16670_c0_g1_i2.p1 TRINITY_DN16670_c0_g1~~TRINITY_DN16670_c0_g1_i2.p1  ORF type:complete len:559 (+),score=83.27 TRINITY_DN16670_c0_g1_i2:289-1965(+)